MLKFCVNISEMCKSNPIQEALFVMLFNCFELLRGVPGGTPGEGQLLKILHASFAGYSSSF